MKRRNPIKLIATTACLTLAAAAHADGGMVLFQENSIPMVSANIVDQFGAEPVQNWVGQPYIVISNDVTGYGDLPAGTLDILQMPDPHSPKPIVGPGGIPVVGPGPRCECPESMINRLNSQSHLLTSPGQ